MTSFYYSEALEVFRKTRAEYLGCAPPDFDTHDLVIVPRPEGPTRKYVAMALTLGTGTVLSVRDDYIAWCRANAPKDKHYRALFPNALLQPLAEEGTRRGEAIGCRIPNLCFIPAQEPVARPVPGGLRAERMDASWRANVWPTGEFHNALGELEPPEEEGFQYALAIVDGDRIAAVAGAWDDSAGVSELGVDVARDYRGRGLAPVVVTGLARLIADAGNVPTYYCAPTNIRSHRNAIASGFTPVASAARATPEAPPSA